MEERYQPATIEQEAQDFWHTRQSFVAHEEPGREKFYCLSMFPYPSGRLHMGHVRNYTIGDVITRYQKMLGKNVLQPMGWDAFGLPAENAAIKHGQPPARWTYANIDYMKGQLKSLGFGYDWNREVTTCRPEYYQWEQWLFTQLMRQGLAYKRMATVNWDPVDQTVLANEQVIDGRGWRSGALVERRDIEQWFLKISAYADELLDGLDDLPGWPDAVRTMQRNWIGRSQGVRIVFGVAGRDQGLEVFTTRPDTLMGVTYVAVAAEHPLCLSLASDSPELARFIAECRTGTTVEAELETMEKRGIALGLSAIHPVTGDAVPIYAANFVLMGYGSGAVMAVPAHDQRDWEFAARHGIARRQVIVPADGSEAGIERAAYTEKGLLRNSGPFDGLTSEQAFEAVADWLAHAGRGGRQLHYRLRDWGVSRQRYWGCPIPVIKDAAGVSEPATVLPVTLPEDVVVDGSGSPLKRMPEFYALPDGRERETDTFDTFFESSWYYARYCCPDAQAMLDERARYWLPVDQYVGGIEHAVLHLLYARFFHKLMRDQGLVEGPEPFTRLLTQGMVLAETYYRVNAEGHKEWFNPVEVQVTRDDKGRITTAIWRTDGQPVIPGGMEKMSKSKNNGVDPQALIERFGADTVRLYTMFTSPPDQSLEWSDEGVEGAHRFLKKLWAFGYRLAMATPATDGEWSAENLAASRRELHQQLKKALFDYDRQQFNTVISACMTMLNALNRLGDHAGEHAVRHEGFSIMLRLLGPIAPHVTHALWRTLGYGDDLLRATWPVVDESALAQAQIDYVVQVNGKVRGRVAVPADAAQEALQRLALDNDNVQKFLAGAAVRKVIVVPGKLINIVV